LRLTMDRGWRNRGRLYRWTTSNRIETMKPTMEEIKEAVVKILKGTWFEDPDYNLNLGGIRNDEEEKAEESGEEGEILSLQENTFNDWIYVAWKEGGRQRFEIFTATTDPGYSWRKDPQRKDGVGSVREGYFPSVYRLGMHGSREALVQNGPSFQVYRDNNRDKVLTLDPSTTEKGWGFNLHYMGDGTKYVNRWSGGCQGPNHKKDIDLIVSLVKKQRDAGMGDRVSYALMRSSWLGDLEWAKSDFDRINGL